VITGSRARRDAVLFDSSRTEWSWSAWFDRQFRRPTTRAGTVGAAAIRARRGSARAL